MSKILELKCTENKVNIEDFLERNDVSGRMFRKFLKAGNISINETIILRKKSWVFLGDIVKLSIPNETIDIEPQDIDIEVLYEDEDIIAINKEPFMVVHPTKNIKDKTLSNAVAYYFQRNNINSKVRVINRLDRDTSGVVLFAKNTFGHQQVAKQLESNTIIKMYYAIVRGILKQKEGLINKPIGRSEDGIKQCIRFDGLESITKYKVIEEYNHSSLLEIQIITGRTHQIRVHLTEIGHPIIGDSLYYKESEYIKRQALHARSIQFKKTREDKNIIIEAPLPNDMLKLIDNLSIK